MLPDLNRFRGSAGRVHLIGCAGVGTLPLARILLARGFRVSGSDLLDTEELRRLRAEGAMIFSGPHRKENLPPDDGSELLVIHTSAAGTDNPELSEALRRGATVLRRGSALAALTSLYRRTVSVSGSHGKTSVTGMLSFLFEDAGLKPGFLIGGFLSGWGGRNGSAGAGDDIFVTEADESDGTHAEIRSHIGIVTNFEDDHAWSLGGVEVLKRNFSTYAAQARTLVYVGGPATDELFADHPDKCRIDPDLAHHAAELAMFDPAALKRWGAYQKINAVTALTAAELLGMKPQLAAEILSRFPGVERRMSVRLDNGRYLLIEDYAHHPTELRECLAALRELHPGRRLAVIFQPHRYARLERYFDDFVRELKKCDAVFIAPVFAAWTASGKYDSADLAAAVGKNACAPAGSWDGMAESVAASLRPGDTVAVIGAGDVKDIIPPLKELLSR